MKSIGFQIAFFTALVLCSCTKQYRYVEIVEESSFLSSKNNEDVIIRAKNDTLAYLEAYQKFTISRKVYNDMAGELGGQMLLPEPKSFMLYDANGVDVSNIVFASRRIKELEIEERIFAMKNHVKEARESREAEIKASIVVDSATIELLKPHFSIEKDEFDPKSPIWYKPKSAPTYTNRNGIYCYFETENDIPKNFRFRVQYYADDWLFFNKVQFSIDGNAYEYKPMSIERDNGDGMIWEWFDESVSPSDREFIKALSEAKTAKMKFIGHQYYDIKPISTQQIIDIKRSIDLFVALGGNF